MALAKTTPSFNADNRVKEINERFNRLIKNVDQSNTRRFSMQKMAFIEKGTDRYQFEVDMAYAINEVMKAPSYMQGKTFESAAGVVNRLIEYLKDNRTTEETQVA